MKHRFGVLDVFRGLFAFMVVLYHLRHSSTSFLVKNELADNSYLFVDFFFVLSGFVIAYNYESKISNLNAIKDFLKKRFFRLYPLQLAMLLILLVYVIVRNVAGIHFKVEGAEKYTVATFFTNLFLLTSVKFKSIDNLSWNYPSWSISSEAISYIVFGVFALAINRVSSRAVKIVVGLLIVLAAIYYTHYLFGNYVEFSTYNNGFIRGLIGFFLGVTCQFIFQKIKYINGNTFWFTVLEATAMLLIVFFVASGNQFTKYGLIYEGIFSISILIFAFEKGLLSSKIKKINLLNEFGKISYSIYMTHVLVITFADILLRKVMNKNSLADTIIDAGIFIAVYFVSKWTYKNIELKFYHRIQKPKLNDKQFASNE